MAFQGTIILITGASSGIGQACAEFFAKENALLSLVGRNRKKFEVVCERIKALGVENEPLIIEADVSVDFERIMSETIEKYQSLDVLINNAGFVVPGTLETTQMDDYDAMFATNLRGLFELTQLALPHLIESKGNVINNSSIGGIRAFPGFLAYCMTKSSVDTFTRCTALELADKGVRVNAVNPGFIDTNFHAVAGVKPDEYSDVCKTMAAKHPIGRIGCPNDVVNAIAFLASDNNSFITGVCLPCDGGITIKNPL